MALGNRFGDLVGEAKPKNFRGAFGAAKKALYTLFFTFYRIFKNKFTKKWAILTYFFSRRLRQLILVFFKCKKVRKLMKKNFRFFQPNLSFSSLEIEMSLDVQGGSI